MKDTKEEYDKLIFDNSYFEDEVIGGFYVPSLMKRCWAVQMEVLFQFTKICEKHNIEYFAEWGTLISAVRHGDMIPWDDDMDVTMKRWEYEKFRKYAEEELPEGYFFTDFETTHTCWQFIVNLTVNERMNFTKEYMDSHYGFPYRAGLDIFILDNYPDDDKEVLVQSDNIKKVLSTADLIFERHLVGTDILKAIDDIEKDLHIELTSIRDILKTGHMDDDTVLYNIRLELYKLAREICGRYNNRKTNRIAQMMPWGIFEHRSMPREFFSAAIYKEYGPTKISIPLYSHELLSRKFGTYYIPYKSGAGHDYPYYENQRKLLGEDVDFVPVYKADIKDISTERRLSPVKTIASDYIGFIRDHADNYNDCQAITIEFGEYLEKVKGSDYELIHNLEYFCEVLFEASQGKKTKEQLKDEVDRLASLVDEYILKKNIYVFIPYKAKYFDRFLPIYEELASDPDNQIYVIPQPLYYKKYDGAKICDYVEEDSYPEDVMITDSSINIEALSPDVIYIQNPYDNYNMALDTDPAFYSGYLKGCCGQLVYIPYFREFDFSKEDERQYYNMKYYCLMPGVVSADKIVLPSQALKDVYIEKLTDEYGHEIKAVYDDKISVDNKDIFKDNSKKKARDIIKDDIDLSKKIILFYTDISLFYQYKEQAVRKLESVIDIFKDSHDISVIWAIDPAIEKELPTIDEKLYQAFIKVKDDFEKAEAGYINRWNLDIIIDACDAYYGDPSPLMQKILDKEKPIMLCNYRV